jgi:hypothetical protein
MKQIHFILLFLIMTMGGCDCNRDDLESRRILLDKKEQQLIAKEDSLRIKEQELLTREKRLDSLNSDSAVFIDSAILGDWDVKMVCIETTCHGSAVGDTKVELWKLTWHDGIYTATAVVNSEVIRVYQGKVRQGDLELAVPPAPDITSDPPPRITVRVSKSSNTMLEGVREITRPDCRIIYSMEMTKKS